MDARWLCLLLAALAACGSRPGKQVPRSPGGLDPGNLPVSELQGTWWLREVVTHAPPEVPVRPGFATSLARVELVVDGSTLRAMSGSQRIAEWAVTSRGGERIQVDWSRNLAPPAPLAGPIGELVDTTALAAPSDPQGSAGRLSIPAARGVETRAAACAELVAQVDGRGAPAACGSGRVETLVSLVRIEDDHAPPPYPDRAPVGADLDGDGAIGASEQLGATLVICEPPVCAARVEVECTPAVLQALAQDPYFASFEYRLSDCDASGAPGNDRFAFRRIGDQAQRWAIWNREIADDGSPIPAAERTPRPIAVRTGEGFPEELVPEVENAASSYGAALLETVAALQDRPAGEYGALRMVALDASRSPWDLDQITVTWDGAGAPPGVVAFAPTHPDPATGRIVAAGVHLHGPAVDRLAGIAVEVVKLLRGEPALDGELQAMDILELIAEQRPRSGLGIDGGAPEPQRIGDPQQLRLDRLAMDPELERSLLDPEDLRPLGWKPGDPATAELLAGASPRTFWAREAERRSVLDRFEREGCLMTEAALEPSVVAMALEHDDAGLPETELRAEMRRRIVRAILLHAMGHALGLEHNFAGSYDALNYPDRFWQIWGTLPQELEQAAGLASGPDAASILRCLEKGRAAGLPLPGTADCLHAWDLARSSVMDAEARSGTGVSSPGRYDLAALRFGYGGLVETFDAAIPPETLARYAYEDWRHIPDWMGGFEAIANRTLHRRAELDRPRVERIRKASSALPVVTGGVCRENCGTAEEPGPTEVPYRSCSGGMVGAAVGCARWDDGAGPDEVVRGAVARYRITRPIAAFRRGRPHWTPDRYLHELEDRTLAAIGAAQSQYLLLGGRHDLPGFANAAIRGIEALARMTRPVEPGWYCRRGDTFHGEHTQPECGPTFAGEKLHISRATVGPYRILPSTEGAAPDGVGTSRDRRAALRLLTSGAYYGVFRTQVITLLREAVIGRGTAEAGEVVRTSEGLRLVPWPLLVPREPDPDRAGVLVSLFTMDLPYALQAAALGLAFLSSPVDATLDFDAYLHLEIADSFDDVGPCGVWDTEAQAQDPVTHKVYCGRPTEDGLSIAFTLVDDLARYIEGYYEPVKQRLEETTPGTAEHEIAKQELNAIERQVRFMVEWIDQIRRVRRVFEW